MHLKTLLNALVLLLAAASGLHAQGLTPVYLRTEYKENPFTDVTAPRLSWELTGGNNQYQTAYQILVASTPQLLSSGKGDLWDSGKILENTTNHIVYRGKPLQSRQRCYWKVRSWDRNGRAGAWSKPAYWEMALTARSDWKAEWIGLDLDSLGKGPVYHLPPAPYLRKEIQVKQGIRKARLYVTALGLYEFTINGKRIGDAMFTPGWTDYNQRVYYQSYDVTPQLKSGVNALGTQLSYGWYAGYLGYALFVRNPVVRGFYGKVPLLKAQLEVEYENGASERFVTGADWKARHGALLESDILNGETYDARLEWPGWDLAGFNETGWRQAQVFPDKPDRALSVYPGPPVKITQLLVPQQHTSRPDGSYIFDMGQNFAGIVQLRVKGNAGDTIRLRFGEKLYPDGRLMTENLRMARATDTYILKGNPAGETWAPKFTFHGFQYVEVKGLRSQPDKATVTGLVIGSDTPKTGEFETDNPMVNQLYSNIDWTQRANYLDVPTDCPQRDERMGWTADAHVYARSATFNRDVASFFTKWITDLNDAQWPGGAFPLYAPRPSLRKSDTFSPGWMEAGIICPYEIYEAYGDTRIIETSWPYMEKFMQFLEERSDRSFVFKEASFEDISPKGGFGDWLSFGKKTSPDLLASFYYAYCADLMATMANAIGNIAERTRYEALASKVRSAILSHYYRKNGRFGCDSAAYGDGKGYVEGSLGFTGHTQTAYANAIYMNLLPAAGKEKAGQWLKQLIEENGGKLATGFLGAKPLLPALSETGNSALAYKLFLSKEFPSWGFEVENGSTSIWERWDSYTKEDGFKYNADMNSFSHYAFGAVCEWMFGNAAGIKRLAPGFSRMAIRPEIAPEGISRLKASYRTPHGIVRSAWSRSGKNITMEITVPVNTTALIYVPVEEHSRVTIGGKKPESRPDFTNKGYENGYQLFETGSGSHVIRVEND